MLYIGNHTTSSKGYEKMAQQMIANGGNTFAFFTRNPRGGNAKAIDETDVKKFLSLAGDNGFGKIVAHAPYTMNCCAAKENLREFARNTMADDLKRMEYTPGNYYNFHPGSHLNKISIEKCLDRIAESVNMTLDKTTGVTAVIENTAGQGSNVGNEFWHLRYIIDKVEDKSRVGVCLDTCHTYTAGYDIANEYDWVFTEFDEVVGGNYLCAIHLNDSKKPLGSRVDRHDSIGKGLIGIDFFRRFMQDSRFNDMPVILETPDDTIWRDEIKMLRSFEL